MAQNYKKLCLSHFVSREPYIIYCDFWYLCVKWWYLQQIFSFFNILILVFFRGIKGKKWPKVPISVCFALYFRNCRLYHQDFDNDIYRCFSLFFFKKCNIVNIKIICFLLAHFNSFINNYLFFKFINKCQKEILTCTSPSSHEYDFLFQCLFTSIVFVLSFSFLFNWNQ